MKKAIVLLLAFAAISGLVFAADDVVPRSTAVPTIAGNGKVTWGIDLNTNHTGFVNSADVKVVFPLIDQASTTHGGDPITGEITLSDLTFSLNGTKSVKNYPDVGTLDFDGDYGTDSLGDITAKILFPSNLYMVVYGKPGLSTNNAKSLAPWVDYADDNDWDDNRGVVKPSVTTTGGIKLGMTGDFSFDVILDSNGDYTTAAGTDVYYGLGADVGYVVKDLLSVNAGVIYGLQLSNVGATVKVTVNPKDSGLTAVVAADVANGAAVAGGTVVTGYDAMATVDYALAKMVSIGAGCYYGDANSAVAGEQFDARAIVKLLAVENLNFQVAFDAWDLTNAAITPVEMFIAAKGDYTIKIDDANYVKPYETFTYCLNDAVAYLKVGVEAKLFPRTVLDVNYEGGAKPGNDPLQSTTYDLRLATGSVGSTGNMGRLLISANVSY